jgi:elongator complex protein 2
MSYVVFASGGCSPESGVIDVVDGGMLVYGAGPNVMLMSDLTRRNARPLVGCGTEGQVHAVKFLQDEQDVRWILAGTAGGLIKTWTIDGEIGAELKVTGSINSLAATYIGGSKWTVLFSSTTGTLYTVHFENGKFAETTVSLCFGIKKIISVALAVFKGVTVGFVGLSDNTLTIVVNNKAILSLPGHTNWINTIDVKSLEGKGLLVATGSSDRTVRVWKIAPLLDPKSQTGLLEVIAPRKKEFELGGTFFTMNCDAIIYGHEGMVNSVRWDHSSMRLGSAGSDRTIIIWRPTLEGGWSSIVQLGDVATITSAGGYYSVLFATIGKVERIIAHGTTGSIIQYINTEESDYRIGEPIMTGHVLDLQSCDWSPSGQCLATTGLDKTTRIWSKHPLESWCEVARPQIHGYEMQALAMLDETHFLSAGDEKILRCFQAPISFTQRLALFTGDGDGDSGDVNVTMAVSVPQLGLSNKAGEDMVALEMPLSRPPTERDLSSGTLWMETDKLYGHGLELHCLAACNTNGLAVSACKSTTVEDAAILFWKRQADWMWKQVASVSVHTLTVTGLEFSPDGSRLLAISRDRHWSIIDTEGFAVELKKEAHTRIIWCGAWFDCKTFVTGSRDKTLKTWNVDGNEICKGLVFEDAVTAVAIQGNFMAIGLENGSMAFYRWNDGWMHIETIKHHTAPVVGLKWQPDGNLLASISNLLLLHQVDCV